MRNALFFTRNPHRILRNALFEIERPHLILRSRDSGVSKDVAAAARHYWPVLTRVQVRVLRRSTLGVTILSANRRWRTASGG